MRLKILCVVSSEKLSSRAEQEWKFIIQMIQTKSRAGMEWNKKSNSSFVVLL